MKVDIKKEFLDDFISRKAGEKLRKIILAHFKNGEVVTLDFNNVTIASTSFFDEAIAKLAEEGWSQDTFQRWVVFDNLNIRDQSLVNDLCRRRGLIR